MNLSRVDLLKYRLSGETLEEVSGDESAGLILRFSNGDTISVPYWIYETESELENSLNEVNFKETSSVLSTIAQCLRIIAQPDVVGYADSIKIKELLKEINL